MVCRCGIGAFWEPNELSFLSSLGLVDSMPFFSSMLSKMLSRRSSSSWLLCPVEFRLPPNVGKPFAEDCLPRMPKPEYC